VFAAPSNTFADDPDGVAETIRAAKATGLAGCSVEDYSGRSEDPIYERGLARERIVAAAEVAHSGPVRMVLTARAENFIRGREDLADTIERLQAYQEAGADVLFAPGLSTAHDIRDVVRSVDRPVSVLAVRGTPSTAALAELGVARVSVGGAFAFAALAGLREAAEELRDRGTYGYLERTAVGGQAARAAFKRGG
jgi:2-methylisocitrate lyase-like PEP mutase family enzyme